MKLSLSAAAKVADGEVEGTFVLRDPFTGDKLQDDQGAVSITMIGAHTRAAQKIRRAIANRRIKNSSKYQDDPAQAQEDESCEFLARCTRRWSNITDGSGETVDFSRENAESTYHIEWIRKQVDEYAANPSNFGESPLGKSAGNSSPTPGTGSPSTDTLEAAI